MLRQGLTALAERYFDGEPLLFSRAAADLDQLIGDLDRLASFYNDAVGDGLAAHRQPELRALTLAGIEAALGEAVADLVAFLVDRAKAEALRLFGEPNAAADLMGRYV